MSDPTPPADAPDLDDLARLEAAATPGPWTINRITGGDVEVHEIYSDAGSGGWRVVSEMGEIEPDSNAAFIAAARNALPALLADHARLVAELAAERDAHHATCDALALERAEVARLTAEVEGLTAERDHYRMALHAHEARRG